MIRQSTPPARIKRFITATATAALATSMLITFPSAVSAADHSVDPSTLIPPPPAFFDAVCREAGDQIICDLQFLDPEMPVEAPTGIMCGSGADAFELLDTYVRTVQGTRYYNSDGFLLRRHFHDDYRGTFTNSMTGVSVSYDQHDMIRQELSTPGDDGSVLELSTGHLRIWSTTGKVLIDTGVAKGSAADGLLFQAGQHPLDAYFNGDTSALQPLCEALRAE